MRQDNDHAHISTSFWVFCLSVRSFFVYFFVFFLSQILLFIISVYLGFCAQCFTSSSHSVQSLTVSQLNAFSNNEPHRTCLVLLNTILLLNVWQRCRSVGTFWSLHKSERKNYDYYYLSRGTFVRIPEIGQLSARVAGAVLILDLAGLVVFCQLTSTRRSRARLVFVNEFEIHSTSIHFSSLNCELNRVAQLMLSISFA